MSYSELSKYTVHRYYYYEAIKYGPEILLASSSYAELRDELASEIPDPNKINELVEELKKPIADFYKDYNKPTDVKLWAKMMAMYYENVPEDQQPEYIKAAAKKYKSDFSKMADKVYKKSIFCDREKLESFLEKPTLKVLENDPAFVAMEAFTSNFNHYNKMNAPYYAERARGNRLFIDALRQMEKDSKFYPDANFTMRLTYGQVKGYNAADAVQYKYYTTLAGLMAKEDPNNPEFIVPARLKELYHDKDYGVYGDGNTLKVCFLSNNDITGGNSGSPVINGNGELIGLAFDGNWEAMSGDIAFEPELQRTISADIRYVLFIIDKFAGATNLIDEMTLVDVKK